MMGRTAFAMVAAIALLSAGCGGNGDDDAAAVPTVTTATTEAPDSTSATPITTVSATQATAVSTTEPPQPLQPGVDWVRLRSDDDPFDDSALWDVVHAPFGWVISGLTGDEGRLGLWISTDGVAWQTVPPDSLIGPMDDLPVVDGMPSCSPRSTLRPDWSGVGPPLATDGNLAIVGCGEGLWTTSDGVTWTRAAVQTPSYYLPRDVPRTREISLKILTVQSIVAGADGWVAVGRGVYGQDIAEVSHTFAVWVSDDGLAWSVPESNMSTFRLVDCYEAELQAAVPTADGWLAAGTCRESVDQYHGSLWISRDGEAYTEVGGNSGQGLLGLPDNQGILALVNGGPGYIAVGWDSPGRFDGGARAYEPGVAAVWVSADGRTWERSGPAAAFENDGFGLATDIIAAGTGFMVVGAEYTDDGDSGAVWRSADGAEWTRLVSDHPEADDLRPLSAAAEGPGGFVAVGGDRVWVSGDFPLDSG